MSGILPMCILASGDPMQHVIPHTLFHIGPFAFTNQSMMLLIAAALMLIAFPLVARDYPMVPKGMRNLLETLMVFIRDQVARPSLHDHTDRFVPYLWALFFFILINNLLGLVPLDPLSIIVFDRGHMFGTATAGLSVTAGLAITSLVMVHASGMAEQYRHQRKAGRLPVAAALMGFVMYWYNFVPHLPGAIGIIMFPMLLVLELIGAAVKPFALCIRLFANMMAGHVVLASLLALAPALHTLKDVGIATPAVLGCVALSFLELFVAFLQAYIFVFLTSMFIGAAVSPEH
jgi:F-type H+-transporting ATPase subunit a